MEKKKLLRITTVPISLKLLLRHQLKFMNQHYDVLAVSSPGKELNEVAEQEQVRTGSIEMTRAITPLKDLKALWRLYKLMRVEKPFIVHTHTPKAGLLGMIAARFAKVPLRLHTVAGMPLLEAQGLKRTILQSVEKLTYSCAHKVYPNSARMKEIIEEMKLCRTEKLKVIGNGSSNGIDVDYFSPEKISEEIKEKLRQELEIKKEDIIFCFIGRMVSDKGINELVAAFAKIYAAQPNLKLILVGPFENELDPLNEPTEKMIETHPGIKWVGFQNDVRPYLALSDVFVFPSYREGFPNVVMQAGAMGLPCIVTDINGCNEIIEEGRNGMIIPVKNERKLEDAMKTLLAGSELRNKMATASRPMIVDRYSQEFVWEALLAEYHLITKEIPAADVS